MKSNQVEVAYDQLSVSILASGCDQITTRTITLHRKFKIDKSTNYYHFQREQ